MAKFRKYAPLLKKLEGGYCDHPNDRGGATMMGVTLNTYQRYYGHDKTKEDLKNISEEEWAHIMKTGYWDRCKADEISDQSIAEIMVDWVVNSGVKGIQQVQIILGAKPDGWVGTETLSLINGAEPHSLFDSIWNARKSFYENIVKKNSSLQVFLKGWMNRLNNFHYR